jgi:N-acetylglutamate synthase-like GNAT family acetyltransferase
MIRQCDQNNIDDIYAIINDASRAYKGKIPADCWHEPYMTMEHLQAECASGVVFWGYENENELLGVMGIQQVRDVTLIRHAYVRTNTRGHGIGSALLSHLKALTTKPVLVGTWAAASWAIRFYEKHGFCLVSLQEKNRLLNTYWSITERQTETSVVLADKRWFEAKL